jgi:hypothetical protein
MLIYFQIKEAFALGSQLKPLRRFLITGSLQKDLLSIGYPISIAEGMAIISEAAVSTIIIHSLEEGRGLTNLKAVFDEYFCEFLQIILHRHCQSLIFCALWMILKQSTASKIGEMILKLVFLCLNFEQ